MEKSRKISRMIITDRLKAEMQSGFLDVHLGLDLLEFLQGEQLWKDEVIEGLIQSGAYRNKLESDPKAAVQALVKQEVDMALDPLISEKARTLILRERDDCIKTCVRRAESLREGSSVAYQCAQDIKMRKKP